MIGKLLKRFVSPTDGVGTTGTVGTLILLVLTFLLGDKEWAESLLSPEFIVSLEYVLVVVCGIFLARVKK